MKMNYQGWYTKKDVIKDLTTAGNVGNFDEEHIIVGERPPPRRCAVDEDDELQILRLYGGKMSSQTDEESKPDLAGIREMLRMVDDFHETPLTSQVSSEDNNYTNVNNNNTIIVITKLDPKSPEFVPRRYANKDLVRENGLSLNNDNNSNTNCDVTTKGHSPNASTKNEETDTISINVNDLENAKPDEIQEEREKLKNKIGEMSKTNCMKEKRERNIAIATLLKLNCRPSAEIKPKLLGPDYFEKTLSDHAKLANDNVTTTLTTKSEEENEILGDGVKDNIKVKNEPVENNENFSISLKPNHEPAIELKPTIEHNSTDNTNKEMTNEIKESIRKVEKWLDKPKDEVTNKKSKGSLYLGPVIFKKKLTSKPISPVSIDSDTSKVRNKDNFVPTAFANELTKKYTERSKERKQGSPDIWTKLELKLKEKDEIIRRKRLDESQSSLDTAESLNLLVNI